jgi:glycogen synthase
METDKRKLRIFYAAGPGDIINTYRLWKQNQEDISIPWLTDSGQFYDLVKELDAEGLAIAYCPRVDEVNESPFQIKHLPKKGGSGISYHIFSVMYGLQLVKEALKFKADIAIVEEGMTEWFVWNILSTMGVVVIPSLKCTLWPEFQSISKKQKVFNFLNRGFFERVKAILVNSHAIANQIDRLTNQRHATIYPLTTVYNPSFAQQSNTPVFDQKPFVVLYVGRLVENKGVFDIFEIAKRFQENHMRDLEFHFCGTGSDEAKLKELIAQQGLTNCFLHGYCNKLQLAEWINRSNVFIVPTHTSFIEGLPNVILESILSNRPVISSRVCPALELVLPAAMEVKPNDVDGYYQAINALRTDRNLYEGKQKACASLKAPFLDLDNSFKAAMHRAIKSVKPT